MHDSVTMIVIIRNREAYRLEKAVSSIRSQGADPTILVIDYGSSEEFSEQYENLSKSNSLVYERLHTEGWPWSRSHAINRGARLATSEYLVSVDVDMIFSSNPISYCLDNFSKKKMFHVDTYWLPKNGKISESIFAGHGNSGGYQFINRSAFFESGGYDEKIKFWGQEELDWARRLRALGYSQEWLPEPHKLYHQWHLAAERGALRPVTASYITMERCARNCLTPKIVQEWGMGVSRSERPILEAMTTSTPLDIDFKKNEISKYDGVMKLCEVKSKSRFIKIKIGKRLVRNNVSWVSEGVRNISRPILGLAGLFPEDKVNVNFDYFYTVLPVLFESGLIDYYIDDNLEDIYMLW